MYRRFAASFVLAALAASVASAQPACTELVVTGHPEYTPVGFRTDGGIGGAGALLVAEIGASLGVAVTFADPPTWEAALNSIRTGTANVIFGIYRTEERLSWLTFVEPPFLPDTAVAMVRADTAFAYTGQDDLVGRRGVSTIGDSWGAAFDAFIAARLDVTLVDGAATLFDTLLAGGADYAIVGYYPAIAYAAANGLSDHIAFLSPPVSTEPLYVAFASSSPCAAFAEPFGAAIAAAIASGRMAELMTAAEAAWGAMPAR